MGMLAIDGLASGLDTTALINQLMQVEAMPQTLLKTKSSTAQSFVTGLQALNTKIASLTDVAAKAAKAESWDAWKATSSAPATTATASASAQPGTISFRVDQLATSQVSIGAVTKDDRSLLPDIPPAVTIKKQDGTLVTVYPSSGDLSAVTKAVNDAADAGIKATAVRVSNAEPPEYRLQFTGTKTGTDSTFEVYAGTAAQVEAYSAAELEAKRLDGNPVRVAVDAKVTLWSGSALEQSFTQSSNTFTGLMTGVDVTVSKVTGATDDPVTITVARDDEAVKTLTSNLVAGLNLIVAEIASQTKVTTKTNTDGTTSVTGGLFSGDNAVRQINERLMSAASAPVGGLSPASAGITLGKDGTFTFDEAKFAAALAADPAAVQAMVSGISERVAAAAKSVSDPIDGSLSLKIQGQESLVKDIGNQITSWDRRLELRREGLERTYSQLEVTLSNLQSQGSWLSGQLASLPNYNNS